MSASAACDRCSIGRPVAVMFDMLPDRIELFLRPFFRLHKRTCKGRRPFEETRHSFGSRAKLGTICTWQPRNHASRNPRYLTLGTWYCNSTRGANMSRAKCGMEVLADSAFFLGGRRWTYATVTMTCHRYPLVGSFVVELEPVGYILPTARNRAPWR